jgi:hypothetical protein
MAKVKNTKHKIIVENLPEGFKLVNGKIVESKSHGGSTGDQIDYGLTKYGSNSSYGSIGTQDPGYQNIRYSLSSVPREEATIEAEGGETVLTDLNNDGNFGLYDIKGPRHSSGGVPMFLPEQSYVFSDTPKMRMNRDELAEFGIESRKKMTPAAVSRKYQLNKYYGLLNDEYADKIQANSAENMLKKNMLSLSKLAFGQEAKKNFSEGVPLSAHPYLASVGEDPIEFTSMVEQITEQEAMEKAMAGLTPEQQQMLIMLQQQMEQGMPAGPPEGMPPGMDQGMPTDAAMQMQAPVMAAARYGGTPRYQLQGETPPPTNFSQAFENQSMLDNNVDDIVDEGALGGVGIDPSTNLELLGQLQPRSFQEMELENRVDPDYIPSIADPTVERDKGNLVDKLTRAGKKVDMALDSPVAEALYDGVNFTKATANLLNAGAAVRDAKQVKEDLKGQTMADKAAGMIEGGSKGGVAVNSGKSAKVIAGQDSDSYGAFVPVTKKGGEFQDGGELDKYQGTEKSEVKSFKDKYMADTERARMYRDIRYNAYVNQAKLADLTPLTADEYHKNYVEFQNQVGWINENLDEEARKNESWNSRYAWKLSSATKQDPNKPWQNKNKNKPNYCNKEGRIKNGRCFVRADKKTYDENHQYNKIIKGAGFTPFDENMIKHMQAGYMGSVDAMEELKAAGLADPSELTQTGTGDQTYKNLAVTDPDGRWGDTMLGQQDSIDFLEEPKEEVIVEEEEEVVKEDPKPIRELDIPDIEVEGKMPVKKIWTQDAMKAAAIADRDRVLLPPYQPPVRRVKTDFAESDITSTVNALDQMYNTYASGVGAISNPTQFDASMAAQQGKMAEFLNKAIQNMNAANNTARNAAFDRQAQLDAAANQEEDRRTTKLYDDTMTALQGFIDEQNFDRDSYVDAMVNLATNAANTYNMNQLRDYYNIDPENFGDMVMINSKALDPVAPKDDYGFIKPYAEVASRYKNMTGQDPTADIMKGLMQQYYGQTGTQPQRVSNLQREISNNPYQLGYKGDLYETGSVNSSLKGGKHGREMKKWAVPFYSGKMGV